MLPIEKLVQRRNDIQQEIDKKWKELSTCNDPEQFGYRSFFFIIDCMIIISNCLGGLGGIGMDIRTRKCQTN